jgi:HD-like signal output (HDOD) protein
MNEKLVERVKQCPTLPSLPRIAIEILALAENPNVALPALARIVSQDAALVSKVLRTVNSSFYGLSQRVSGIDHALVVLGMEGVKTLVLGFSLVADLKKAKPRGGFDHLAYWRRSLYGATAARIFAEQFGVPLLEEAFLSALLMDIGMLALDQVLGAEYAEITAKAPSHAGLGPMEMAALGMNHAEVTAVLAQHWKLPPSLALPMAHHHKPQLLEESSEKQVAEVVWLAGRVADVFVDKQPEWSLCDVRRVCMDKYRINELDCDAILCRIGMKTNALGPLFEVPMDPGSSYENILRRANDGLLNMTRALHQEEAPSDKRRSPRFKRGGAITVYPYANGQVGEPIRAQFRDASAQGLGIHIGCALPAGAQFIVRLPQKQGDPLPILYTVVRAERIGEAEHRIGAELTCVLRQKDGAAPNNRPAPTAAATAAATATAAAAEGRPAPDGGKPADPDDGIERIRRAILAGI